MARSLRDIRRKMKAIKSTRQVTKAMELVAGSKMRRAVQSAQLLKEYAHSAYTVLERIAEGLPGEHPFLQERDVQNVLCVLFTSDRGLCGSLNAQLLRTTSQYVEKLKGINGFQSIEFIGVGRKGQQFLSRTGQRIVAAFPALSNHPSFRDVLPITRVALDGFSAGTYDHIVLIYADFISPLVQEPAIKVLLPFSQTVMKDMIASIRQSRKTQSASSETLAAKYAFEPSPAEVLNTIMPQLTEVQMYQAVLESAASEHSARMLAMRNASDNASDILGDLTLTYNQTRQAGITAELAELSAATAALG